MKAIAKYMSCPKGEHRAAQMDGITYSGQALEVVERNPKHKLTYVKLFAVTQDIEVGEEATILSYEPDYTLSNGDDEVNPDKWRKYLSNIEFPITVTQLGAAAENDLWFNHEGNKDLYLAPGVPYNWFKVLGELSPDATWVKDQDKIEVKKRFPVFEHDEGEAWELITGWHPGDYEKSTPPKKMTVEKKAKDKYGKRTRIKKSVPVKVKWITKVLGPCGHYH